MFLRAANSAPAFGLAALALAVALAPSIASADVPLGEPQSFVEKKYDIDGGWSVVEENGRTLVRFDDDFATEGGPDLKVFLSPTAIDAVDGDTATDGSVLLGELVSTDGGQEYALPEGLSLEDFRSVLIHCEEFSVLWGGGAL